MFTLFDFITFSNAVLYGLALAFVAGFIVYWEVMKPRPFRSFAESLAEDIRFMRGLGKAGGMSLVKKALMAPIVVAMYFAALPLMFAQGMARAAADMAGALSSAGWNPVEAYLAGRRRTKKRQLSAADEKGKES